MSKRSLVVLFLCCALLWGADYAGASERILEMNVRAAVQKDASVLITEEIRFIAEGREIKRGLIRSIPVRYSVEGKNMRIGFAVAGAVLDGGRVPYEVSRAGADLEIRLGRANVFLTPGEHVYLLTYRVSDVVSFMADHDELYWNVTGDRWAFPIERASFRIELPGGVTFTGHSAYTGRPGSKGGKFRLEEDGTFRTTAFLRQGEGFTVAVGWPKGIVSAASSTRLSRGDGRARGMFFASLVLMVGWYGFAWLRWGKDPHSHGVFPRFEPPAGMEPALVRYIYRLNFDVAALSADILYLAMQGFLSIEERAGDVAVRPNEKPTKGIETLSEPHRELLGALFTPLVPELILEQPAGLSETLLPSAHRAVNQEGSPTGRHILKLLNGLPGYYGVVSGRIQGRPPLFSNNLLPSLAGILLLVPLCFALSFVDSLLWHDLSFRWSRLSPYFYMLAVCTLVSTVGAFRVLPMGTVEVLMGRFLTVGPAILTLGTLAMAFVDSGIWTFAWSVTRSFDGLGLFLCAGVFHAAFVYVLVALLRIFMDADDKKEKMWAALGTVVLVVAASGISVSLFLMIYEDFLIAGGVFVVGAVVAVLVQLMPSRTRVGRYLLDQVEGLRMYLNTAERHRLEFLYPAVKGKVPEDSPELFERCLPYALALGAAETWANGFSEMLVRSGYDPTWYRSVHGFRPMSFSRSLVYGFANGMASTLHASYPKVANSFGGRGGLGGGGFSGGGFGGGGGRGW